MTVKELKAKLEKCNDDTLEVWIPVRSNEEVGYDFEQATEVRLSECGPIIR